MEYVEGLNGETARHSRVSALAAEAHAYCGLTRKNSELLTLYHLHVVTQALIQIA